MATAACEKAIEDALKHGKALLKSISANDCDLTGGHQYGYYLPKDPRVWPLFTPQAPVKGEIHTHEVEVTWQDGRVTESAVHWYGKDTRSEYRLTRFGRGFPFRTYDSVGDLLILVPVENQKKLLGYVLDLEEDIEEVYAKLGVSPFKSWALFDRGDMLGVETESECIERNFKDFVKELKKVPTGDAMSEETWRVLEECIKAFAAVPADEAIVMCMNTEFDLFKTIERHLYADELTRPFGDVEEFLDRAKSITQSRKSRSGRSLENHVDRYLSLAGIPHEMRPKMAGNPDVMIPNMKAYEDMAFPDDRLAMIAVKRTCKDRWPQVLKEAKRIKEKHLLTFQQGMGLKQLQEMKDANVTLVVPAEYHKYYPPKDKAAMRPITVQEFIDKVKSKLN